VLARMTIFHLHDDIPAVEGVLSKSNHRELREIMQFKEIKRIVIPSFLYWGKPYKCGMRNAENTIAQNLKILLRKKL
jgi:hypothetical protein